MACEARCRIPGAPHSQLIGKTLTVDDGKAIIVQAEVRRAQTFP
jgi:hypothetical protein